MATNSFYLPPHTPYGNLTLKMMKVIRRLDHINMRIQELNAWFSRVEEVRQNPESLWWISETTDDICLGDEITFWLKRTLDELVALLFLKRYWEKNAHSFPTSIEVDSLGSLINGKTDLATSLRTTLNHHLGFLETINDVANVHKHSFLNTDFNVISGNAPQIFALALRGNALNNKEKFYSIPVQEVVERFNSFYKEVLTELKEWSAVCLKIQQESR